jgi:hypothetical protein
MIHHVLQVISKDLNLFLKNRLSLNEDIVILSELVNQDGSVAISAENRIICTLLNIEQERVNLNSPLSKKALINPPINLNLFVLFSAFYASANYVEALKSLSLAIGFFQGKQVFTSANTPAFVAGIDKITVEMVNVEMNELSNFWTAVGSKHLPCVLYKFRMVSLTADMILEEYAEVGAIDAVAR